MAASLRRRPARTSCLGPLSVFLGIFCACLVPALGVKYLNSFAGPYIVYVDNIYQCDPKDYSHDVEVLVRGSHFNPHRRNKLQIFNGNFSAKIPIPFNSMWAHLRMDTRSNNQWKENSFIFPFYGGKGCSLLKQHAPYIYQFLMDISKGHYDVPSCTLQPGTYLVKDYALNFTFPHFPTMPYGHWRIYVRSGSLQDKSTALMCLFIECHTVNKI